MSGHTPGPWVAERKPRGWYVMADRRIRGDLGYRWQVAVQNGDPKHGEAMEANARLIAAAPELLACLKEAVASMQDADQSSAPLEDGDPLADWRAAISKAEGR